MTTVNIAELNRLVCEALGVDPVRAKQVSLTFARSGVVAVVEMLVTDEAGHTIAQELNAIGWKKEDKV